MLIRYWLWIMVVLLNVVCIRSCLNWVVCISICIVCSFVKGRIDGW